MKGKVYLSKLVTFVFTSKSIVFNFNVIHLAFDKVRRGASSERASGAREGERGRGAGGR